MIARYLALALVVFAAGCDNSIGDGPVGPGPVGPGPVAPNSQNLSGEWDATYFKDAIRRDGTPTTSTFYGYSLELRQEGDALLGTLTYSGDDAFSMPISGAVVNSGVTYSGERTHVDAGVPVCRITVTAELTVDAHATRLAGPMSFTYAMLDPRIRKCHGTATGTLEATKE